MYTDIIQCSYFIIIIIITHTYFFKEFEYVYHSMHLLLLLAFTLICGCNVKYELLGWCVLYLLPVLGTFNLNNLDMNRC